MNRKIGNIILTNADVNGFLDQEMIVALDTERKKKLTFNPFYQTYTLWSLGIKTATFERIGQIEAINCYNRY